MGRRRRSPEFGEARARRPPAARPGFANGVGMAFAERWLNHRFGDDLVNHFTYVLCSDGCLMEGISHEAASLAGHLGLGMVVLYDDIAICRSWQHRPGVHGRWVLVSRSYGWQVLRCDGHDQQAIAEAIRAARADEQRQNPDLLSHRHGHGARRFKERPRRTARRWVRTRSVRQRPQG